MRLFICLPHASLHVVGPWYHHIYNKLVYPTETTFLESFFMPIATARNELVTKAYRSGATHILFIDDDIWPSSQDAVIRLATSGKDIISGLCRYRTPEKNYVVNPSSAQKKSGIVEIESIGGGFLMVNVEVFKAMAGQFDFEDVDFFRWAGSTRAPTSEDITFCRMAKKLGFQIWVNCDVKCGHHDYIIYDDSMKGRSKMRDGSKEESYQSSILIGERISCEV